MSCPSTGASKAPCGGERAGRSPVDRGKQGLKRSVATKARGVPIGLVSAGANRHDSPLLVPTLEAAKKQVGVFPEQVNVNLDRGYDSDKTRAALEELGFTGEIARKGVPAPIQAGKRWVVERSHAWCAPRRVPYSRSQRVRTCVGDGKTSETGQGAKRVLVRIRGHRRHRQAPEPCVRILLAPPQRSSGLLHQVRLLQIR